MTARMLSHSLAAAGLGTRYFRLPWVSIGSVELFMYWGYAGALWCQVREHGEQTEQGISFL